MTEEQKLIVSSLSTEDITALRERSRVRAAEMQIAILNADQNHVEELREQAVKDKPLFDALRELNRD